MKTVTIYRRDFKESAEANLFEDMLNALRIPADQWDSINKVEIKVDSFKTE